MDVARFWLHSGEEMTRSGKKKGLSSETSYTYFDGDFDEKVNEKANAEQKVVVPLDTVDTEPAASDYRARTRGFFRRSSDRSKLKVKKQKKRPVALISMELKNGLHREFLVKEHEKGGFVWNKKRYVFDIQNRYYNIDSNLWCYDYHEDFTLPLKRQIPVNDIKKAIEASRGITEVEYSFNPSVLDRFIMSEIAQAIIRGASLGALFKLLVILVVIVMFIVAGDLILAVYSSGIIESFSGAT